MTKLLGLSANIAFGLLLSASIAQAQNSAEVFNLTEAVRTAQAEGNCRAPTIEGKSFHASYAVTKAFNGVTISTSANASERWLSTITDQNADGSCYALYRLPSDYRPGDYFVLDSYTIWRANATAGYDPLRTPTRWAIYGIDDDGSAVLLTQVERTIDEWGREITPENQEQTRKGTFLVESNEASERGYRAFKFVPYETASTAGANFGICELEFMVRTKVEVAPFASYEYEPSTQKVTISADSQNLPNPVNLALEIISPTGTTTTNTLAENVVADGSVYRYEVAPFTDEGTYQFKLLATASSGAVIPADPQAFHRGSVELSSHGELAAHLNQYAEITVSRTPAYPASMPLTIPISYSGSAVANDNYQPNPETITIPAGATSASFTLTGIVRRTQIDARSITLTIPNGSYTSTNPEATVNMQPIPESYFYWIYADGGLSHIGDSYAFKATITSDNQLTLHSATADPSYPPLYLDDPVRDAEGNSYVITRFSDSFRLANWPIHTLQLPPTLEAIPSYTLVQLSQLQKLVMKCPKLEYCGWATISGAGTFAPLKETTLEDWNLAGLKTVYGGSFNSSGGISGIKGTLTLPKIELIADNCFSGHALEELALTSPGLHTVSNSFTYATIKRVYFAITNNLTLGSKAFNNGAKITTYSFEGEPQSDSNLDLLTKSAADWQITINASASKGWLELPTLTSDRDAITAMLTPSQQNLYADILNNSKLLGVITTQPTGRKVWLIHQNLGPKKQATLIFIQ